MNDEPTDDNLLSKDAYHVSSKSPIPLDLPARHACQILCEGHFGAIHSIHVAIDPKELEPNQIVITGEAKSNVRSLPIFNIQSRRHGRALNRSITPTITGAMSIDCHALKALPHVRLALKLGHSLRYHPHL